jgi:hypothetical protein
MNTYSKLARGAVLLGAAALAAPVFAIDIYGLTTRNQLVRFDSSNPNALLQSVFISGMTANEAMIGFDFRPSNGRLYGVGSFGNIYTLNTVTGSATFVSAITGTQLNGVEFGVDFNPAADRLRVTSDLDQNLRINVDTGATLVDGALFNTGGGNPNIVASAYLNNDNNPNTGTSLYNLDSFSNMLTIQNPPNSGAQTNVGWTGLDFTALAGFDIYTVGNTNTAYAAMQVANTQGSSLFTLNLTTGAATAIGGIGNSQTGDSLAIRDIAAVPEPATLLALGVGAAALLRRRRAR